MSEHHLGPPLIQIINDLNSYGSRYAILGGIAIGAHTNPRFTNDVDLAVVVENDEEAEKLIHFLLGSNYTINSMMEQDDTGRLATIRLAHAEHPDILVDLLFASSGIEDQIVKHAQEMTLFGNIVANVASIGHLIATKLLSESEHRTHDKQEPC